jgi:hypothetical protein
MSSLKNGINCTYFKKVDEDSSHSSDHISVFKMQGNQGYNLENHHYEETKNKITNSTSKSTCFFSSNFEANYLVSNSVFFAAINH